MAGELRGRVDAEGVMVLVRWMAVLFAVVQTATYYRPFPGRVEEWAWLANGAFALAAAALTAWWIASRGPRHEQARRWLGAVAMGVDVAFVTIVTWIYAFDPDTAIFAIIYVVILEAAFRYGSHGAYLITAVLGLLYAARDAWAAQQYGTDLLVASISFRVGIGFFIAAVAGAMADRHQQEHERLEAALASERAAASALRSLDELRSTFLAAVSHELRTPLTSILGFSMTIQDRSQELAPTTRVMLDQVVEESLHLGQLLEDLLEIERMGRGSVVIERHPVDLAELARALAERVMHRVGRTIQVQGDESVIGVVDRRKVDRIIENLLGNAARYSPEHGHVTLDVRRTTTGRGTLITVEDEGLGVPEELRVTIFAPFERGSQTSSHQPGTGIGLSLVDRFARLHGGRAWVEDRVDGRPGASFRVYLPDGPEGTSIATVVDEPWGSEQARVAPVRSDEVAS